MKIKKEENRANEVKYEGIKPVTIRKLPNDVTVLKVLKVKTPLINVNTKMIFKSDEIHKHKHNIKEVMLWSNATPIRRNADMGYMCCYCDDYYLDPADLKKHTLENHKDVTKAYFIKNTSMYQYSIKLDITALQCTICEKNIETTEELMHHLTDEHKKKIFTDIKSHIIPFKFDTQTLECFICKNVFNKFKQLLVHMNMHLRNYICEVCDAGFVNYCGYKYHKLTHDKGSFTCELCPKTFDTLTKKRLHVRSRHIHKHDLHKCGYCNENFHDYFKKQRHLDEAHGVKVEKATCQACNKVFSSRKHLVVHVKRDHLMERHHKCTQCEMVFFSSNELKNHMVKHTGVRSYQCSVCLKSYGFAKTLKEHMRIHEDDRRFKCTLCGQAFVQKCSWKGHMKSKHGEIV